MKKNHYKGYRKCRGINYFLLKGYDLDAKSQKRLNILDETPDLSLQGCDVFEWDLENKKFHNLNIEQSLFTDSGFEGCSFENDEKSSTFMWLSYGDNLCFIDCTFKGVSFGSCAFDGCKFCNCAFVECDFQSCDMRNSSINACDFASCTLNNNAFKWCDFRNNYFNGCEGQFNERRDCTNRNNHFLNTSSKDLSDLFDPEKDKEGV